MADFCNNGEQALARIKARVFGDLPMFKLILMDFSMPGCDGPSSTKLIREFSRSNERAQQPYICFVTSYTGKAFF